MTVFHQYHTTSSTHSVPGQPVLGAVLWLRVLTEVGNTVQLTPLGSC